MFRYLQRQLVRLLLGLGLWTAGQEALLAQTYPGAPYYPPPYASAPMMPPGMMPQPAPGPGYYYPAPVPLVPVAPAYQPVSLTPGPVPPSAALPIVPVAPATPAGPVVAPPGKPAVTAAGDAEKGLPAKAAPVVKDKAKLATASAVTPAALESHKGSDNWEEDDPIGVTDVLSAVTMLGRGDSVNRFNIFDNMNALPQNRVWYGYQSLSDFKTGFGEHLNQLYPLAQYRIVQLHRLGMEWAWGNALSLTVQGQYVASTGTVANNDAWANPQVMFKWACWYTDSTIISPVLAVQIQTPQQFGELHEQTSRLMPGCLFFQALNEAIFVQGGAQLSFPFADGATTFDMGVSLGWWLYRDGSLEVAGRRTQTWERTALPFLTGMIPQVELFGKHVLSGANSRPLDPYLPGQTTKYSGYEEVRHVYDMTAGVRFLIYNHFALGVGYSFPLTGKYVRSDEFISTLNINF